MLGIQGGIFVKTITLKTSEAESDSDATRAATRSYTGRVRFYGRFFIDFFKSKSYEFSIFRIVFVSIHKLFLNFSL